jgi:hypothetical protein
MPRAKQSGLKPSHKLVQAYYAALAQFDQHHITRETAVRQPLPTSPNAASQPGLGNISLFDVVSIKQSLARWGFGPALVFPTAPLSGWYAAGSQ